MDEEDTSLIKEEGTVQLVNTCQGDGMREARGRRASPRALTIRSGVAAAFVLAMLAATPTAGAKSFPRPKFPLQTRTDRPAAFLWEGFRCLSRRQT